MIRWAMELIERDVLEKLETGLDLFSDSGAWSPQLVRLNLCPPLCITETRIVWGFPILKTARKADITRLWCEKMAGNDLDCLKIALLCEGRENRYALTEKARIGAFLEEHGLLPEAEEIGFLVQDKGNFLPQAAQYRSLPPSVRIYVDENLLDLKHAEYFFGLGRETAFPESIIATHDALFRSFTFSERREFLSLLLEIGLKNGIGVGDGGTRLRPPAMGRALADIAADPRPLEALRALRFPGYTGSLRHFEEIRNRMFQGSGVKLSAPANFEGSGFNVEFSLTSKEKLKRVIHRLSEALEYTDELFDILR